MDQYLLCEDLYALIFNYLDYYSKLSFSEYLSTNDISQVNFIKRIPSPKDEDIVSIYKYDVSKILFILEHFKISDDHLLEIYIKHFDDTKSFSRLLKLLNVKIFNDHLHLFINYENVTLFKFIHDEFDIHYDECIDSLKYIYPKNNYYKNYKLFFRDNIKCWCTEFDEIYRAKFFNPHITSFIMIGLVTFLGFNAYHIFKK